METYEALFIIKPDLNKDEQGKVVESIHNEITKQNGQMKESQSLEKKSLAYEIKKHKEGLYYLINFEAPGNAIKTLNHAYNLNNSILRSLIINKGK